MDGKAGIDADDHGLRDFENQLPSYVSSGLEGRDIEECVRPKKRGYEDTNVTAFVKRDYNYGPRHENRSERLHQIRNVGVKGEKPNGYVMDKGRIVLDAFDRGLRNFGSQLPMYISSEVEGHDIEDYHRRNREISVYDFNSVSKHSSLNFETNKRRR